MKIIRHLPDAPEPTKAAYKKPVIGEGKYIKVLPSVYKPKPAPIPKRQPKSSAWCFTQAGTDPKEGSETEAEKEAGQRIQT